MNMVLTPDLLVSAYANGYFPMPHPETEEICWFNPDPRAILPLNGFHVSRSLKKRIQSGCFTVTFDKSFGAVIDGCADREETWINAEIREAFLKLYEAGHGHSVEVWQDGSLVGGTYGLAIRGAFFAESMFHKVTDASKVALFSLVEHLRSRGMSLLEVQFLTPHLASLGAVEIKAEVYARLLQQALRQPVQFTPPKTSP